MKKPPMNIVLWLVLVLKHLSVYLLYFWILYSQDFSYIFLSLVNTWMANWKLCKFFFVFYKKFDQLKCCLRWCNWIVVWQMFFMKLFLFCRLLDNDTSTFWQSDGPARSHWVRYEKWHSFVNICWERTSFEAVFSIQLRICSHFVLN